MPGAAGDTERDGVADPRYAPAARLPAPPTDPATDPVAHAAWLLRDQARSCAAMGSPLYDHLLRGAADDVEAGGPTWAILREHVAVGRSDALALRLMAGVHRLVLSGRAPELARYYPSVGGTVDLEGAWEAFRATLAVHAPALGRLVALPCQTNEVGRAAGLVIGFLHVAAATGLPLRCLEVGASAGLNLRWDHFSYGGGDQAWGDPASPVDLTGLWRDPPVPSDVEVRVVERRGCDPNPVDPTTEEGRLALSASVWADQVARLARLRGALRLAREIPAVVDQASLDDWTAARLRQPADGVATVVYHSVVEEYLPEPVRERFVAALADAADRASAAAPLAWVRLEPVTALRAHALTVTAWPSGDERVLAVCGAHGSDVRRP